MKSCKHRLSFAVAALLLSTASNGQTKPRSLMIVSSHAAVVRQEIEAAFIASMKASGGGDVKLSWIDQGGSVSNFRYIQKKFADAKRNQTASAGLDIVWGGGSQTFVSLKQRQQLEKLVGAKALFSEQALVKGPEAMLAGSYDKDGFWIGSALATFGVLYDREALERLVPGSSKDGLNWDIFKDPRLNGQLIMADPRTSGVALYMLPQLYRKLGLDAAWQLWTGMFGNANGISLRSADGIGAVTGKKAVAVMAIDYLALNAVQTDDKRLGFALPKPFLDADIDPIGKFVGAPGGALADAFVRFVLSERGQRIITQAPGTPGGPSAQQIGRLSALKSLNVPAAAKLRVNPQDATALFGISSKVAVAPLSDDFLTEVVGGSFVDQLPLVREAWAACAKAVSGGDAKAAVLTRPIYASNEIAALAKRWADPGAKTKVLQEFRTRHKAALDAAKAACAAPVAP